MNQIEDGKIKSSGWLQFFYILWTVFACSFVMTVVAFLVIQGIYKVSLTDIGIALSSIESNREAILPAKIMQLIMHLGTFAIPPFAYLFFRRQNSMMCLKLEKFPSVLMILMGILLVTFSVPLLSVIIEANHKMALPPFLNKVEYWMRMQQLQMDKATKIFLEMNSIPDLLLNMLVVGIVPAIGEELLFRGLSQRFFAEWTKNIHWGIWISAFFFSAIHLQFFEFFPRFLLGALLGYMFYWSGNLWVPILAHFFNNGSQVLLSYLFQQGMMETNIDDVETFPVYIIIIFSVLFALLLFIFYKKRTE